MFQTYGAYITELRGCNERYYKQQESKRYKVSVRGGRCPFEGTIRPFIWKDFAQKLREVTGMTIGKLAKIQGFSKRKTA